MGERIGELRRRVGLSQEKLARALGVGRDAVSLWERGKRTPMLDTAAKLAEALGVTVGVIAGTEPMPPPAEPSGEKRSRRKKGE
jgi:transcriptional regulator with XRE-family HTH domain